MYEEAPEPGNRARAVHSTISRHVTRTSDYSNVILSSRTLDHIYDKIPNVHQEPDVILFLIITVL